MATRSTISIKNDDGSVDSIYCHNDGYPDDVGTLLLKNYTDKDKIRELISLGDISYLGPTTDQNSTCSYYRWRNDPLNINHHDNESDIELQEYNYLWKNDKWWMREKSKEEWIPLDQVIIENNHEEFYPKLNEIYHGIGLVEDINDYMPSFLKQQFKKIIRVISFELEDEGFSEQEIEDYLKHLVERYVI